MTVPASQEAWALTASLLGFKDWSDATDYRLTGKQDQQVSETLAKIAHFEQAIRKDEAEKCARVAETYWVEADYNTVGIADADMAMELCRQSAAALRARHAHTDQTGGK